MRAAILVLFLTAAAGCSPEIGAGTYYCGPERLCPPDLVCDEPTYTCESDIIARPFECAEGTEVHEPDGELATARDLMVARCGSPVLGDHRGCLAAGDSADLFRFEIASICSGEDPHLTLTLSYTTAFTPMVLEVLDDQGNVVATAEPCSASTTGTDSVCLELEPQVGIFHVRVRLDDGAPDCGGDCRYNHYWLDIQYPLA
jgi:hypothetical protein